MAVSDALAWRLNSGGSADDLYKDIRTFLGASPDAAATQAAMAQYGISGEDVANATGGASGGLLSGNILAGASWNSTNTALENALTEATGQQTSNYAVGGSTTADTLNQLNTYLAGGGQFDPNATVYLQAGGVDFITGVDKAVVKDNLNQIVKTLGDQGVNVVLTGSPYAKSVEDVINNNFDTKVDQIFNDVAKANSNVALVGTQGEILQNKKLLVDALHTNAEGTAIYNQSVIDALSQFKNEVPSSTPQAIAQAYQTNIVATTPSVITQAAASPVVAQSLSAQIQTPEVDYYAQQFAPDVNQAPVTQSVATQSVDSLIRAGNLNPTQIAAATGVPISEIITQAAALAPIQGSTRLGDTYVSPSYRTTGSGMDEQVLGVENIYTSKIGDNGAAGTQFQQYSPTGEFQTTGTNQKVGSFFGGLAEAFNDPFVQAAVLGLGGGGALGNLLGLTGSTAQAVGTGLFKGGAAAAGGASLEDALKTGLLSGGLVYGGNELANAIKYQNVPVDFNTMTQDQINDALDINFRNDLARTGMSDAQIKSFLANPSGVYDASLVEQTTAPVAVSTPVTDGAVNITAPANVSLNNVLSTIGATAPTVTVTAPKTSEMTTQQAIDLVNSQLAANLGTPANLATQTITAQKPATSQEIVNAITATLPNVTSTQAQNIAQQVITSNRPVTTQEVIAAITATLPALTTGTTLPTSTVPTTTITAPKTVTTQDIVNAIIATTPAVIPTSTIPTTTVTAARPVTTPETINTIASTLTPTAVTKTTTPTTPTKETDPLKVAQLALTAVGLLGAGSVLSSSGTPTGFGVVPIPASFGNPPAPSVAPYRPLAPINFGNRNLLMGTQWEKFLDPNYGQVPAPVQYSQPSNMSYNDLMGILGSRQGMPSKSSLSINDIISGIQNQYGQAPVSAMG